MYSKILSTVNKRKLNIAIILTNIFENFILSHIIPNPQRGIMLKILDIILGHFVKIKSQIFVNGKGIIL